MLLIIDRDGQVLLRRRPADGLWGGLWSLPEITPDEDTDAWCRRRLGQAPLTSAAMPRVRHGFTHFELEIQPRLLQMPQPGAQSVMDDEDWLWYNRRSPSRIGLAAIVERLIAMIESVQYTGGDSDEQNGQLRRAEGRG